MYVKFKGDRVEAFTEKPTQEQLQSREWTERWSWESFAKVETIARYLTAMTGEVWLPVDNSEAVSPRYDVMRAPKVGDKISYGFNGDYYPDGEIVKISPKWMVTSSTGSTYRRRGNSAHWAKPGGTWGMVHGHVDRRNPHF